VLRTLALVFLVSGSAVAAEAPPERATNVYFGYGRSLANWHGQALFRTITLERTGPPPAFLGIVTRRVPKVRAGMSLTYSDVSQPRSWFGHRDGDPDDRVRAEWAYFFLRRAWRDGATVRPYIDLGSGPMWSNRRIPAATSRFNFHSQLNLGLAVGAPARRPLYFIYRFSHISNFEFVGRNPGWNVHSLLIGTRIR
jgi:hypothetical protein